MLFLNKIFQNILTAPLQPQSDGMVEHYIETVEEHLRKVVSSYQRDWKAVLSINLLA
jgi:hypothetical protein